MKHGLITAALLVMLSVPIGQAADWYDPEGWLDDDETAVQFEWWSDGVPQADGRTGDYNIYGFDSGLARRPDQAWGYGYDYSTVDWYDDDDPFTEWYQRNNDWF